MHRHMQTMILYNEVIFSACDAWTIIIPTKKNQVLYHIILRHVGKGFLTIQMWGRWTSPEFLDIPSTPRLTAGFKAYIWMPPWTWHQDMALSWGLWLCGKLHITLGFKGLTAHRARGALLFARHGPASLGAATSRPAARVKSPWLLRLVKSYINGYSDPENFEYHWRKKTQTVTLQSSPSSNQTWLPVAGKSTI